MSLTDRRQPAEMTERANLTMMRMAAQASRWSWLSPVEFMQASYRTTP